MKTGIIVLCDRYIGYILLVAFLVCIGCGNHKKPGIAVYSSSQDGDRMTMKPGGTFSQDKETDLPVLQIDESTRFQKIDGFGATFNEAGMICLNSLDSLNRLRVVKMLFDPDSGAGYTLMKSPIAACDFASAGPWYSYDENPGDTAMDHFTIERDLAPDGLIPFIKLASRYGKFEIESPMDFAPDWMYFSLKPGEKHIKPIYYRALARYYSKYLQAYADQGVTIGYLNLFNEAHNPWYSNVTYETMGLLIKDFLVPMLQSDGVSVNIQLGETSNRPEALEKFPAVLDNPEVSKHIHSLTVHGYDWDKFQSLDTLHNRYPGFPIWMTEVCYVTGTLHPPDGPDKSPVTDFSDGEFWGNMIANDMKNWVSGWIYWNMILDQDGGPWLVSVEHGDPDPNQQHPVVIIDRKTGEITYTGLYYYLTHFSRFVRPGAYRIACTGGLQSLNAVAFRNSDGTMVLNIINNGDETGCKISWQGNMTIQTLKAHSITTIMWDNSTIN